MLLYHLIGSDAPIGLEIAISIIDKIFLTGAISAIQKSPKVYSMMIKSTQNSQCTNDSVVNIFDDVTK